MGCGCLILPCGQLVDGPEVGRLAPRTGRPGLWLRYALLIITALTQFMLLYIRFVCPSVGHVRIRFFLFKFKHTSQAAFLLLGRFLTASFNVIPFKYKHKKLI